MAARFIDTNVFLRHFLADDQDKAAAAQGVLLRIESGEEQVMTSHLVLFELVFILHRTYKLPKDEVVALVAGLLDYRGLQLVGKEIWRTAFDVWTAHTIDFTDAYNVAVMRATGVTEIYAWDRGYNQVADITRIEPGESSEEEAA